MTVSIAFAIMGGVILLGFFANLLFRATKIPSVLILIAIGVILGPVTGWVPSESLFEIAPIFGTMALLMILFEGGLQLDIASVVRQAPKAALLAFVVFLVSTVSVAALSFFVLHISMFNSLMLAAIFGASSPAICLPVISGLSIRKEVQTILKLESTLGDVLLIVTVVLILDFHTAGSQGAMNMVSRFFLSFVVAFVIASVAGVLWSRLIGWMGKEPLAYMLTLGFVFLLYFSVEELGGSAAIAVLIFGILLENMHVVADQVGGRMRHLFGIDVRAEQFVLHEFMKNITEELSFLIRTFFFVYLGLILNFRSLTPWIAASSGAIVLLLLVSRWIGVQSIKRQCRFTVSDTQIVMSMLPRGLATAVMAFLPVQYGVSGTELLPVYAFTVIVLTNILMTGGVVVAERRVARAKGANPAMPAMDQPPIEAEIPEIASAPEEAAPLDYRADAGSSVPESRLPPKPPEKAHVPFSFTRSMSRLFGIRSEEAEWRYIEAIKSSSFAQPQFWAQIFFASVLTVLGLVTNQSAIIIGAALIVPIAWPVTAAGMALAVGDIYLFLKLLIKIALVAALTAAIAAFFSGLLPFGAFTAEIAARTRPTILDFLVAFFAGMAGAAMLFSRKKMLQIFPGAVLAVTLLPPLAVMGLGLGDNFNVGIFRGGAILFTANFFAAILGASLTYAVVGMQAVASLKGIHEWKQRELSHPIVKFIFERLWLRDIAGRTGSVRSRLVVSFVFLIALVIPLQMAFNQLNLEFRARQAISEVEKMFELPGRSAIINSSSNIGENTIGVRIQVATNNFFTASDIRRFEERIADRTGRITRLDLVQSLSDIGEGEKIRGMLKPAPAAGTEYGAGIQEISVRLRDEIEKNLQLVPLPQSMAVLGASAELGLDGQPSSFRIHYLADDPLSEDARLMLASMLESQMKLGAGSVHLTHIPSRYSLKPDFNWEFSSAGREQLQGIQGTLAQYPQLLAVVELPGAAGERRVAKLRTMLLAAVPLLSNASRGTFTTSQSPENRSVTVTLRAAAVPGN